MASMQIKFVRTCWERRCVCNNLARFHRSHTRVLSFARPYQTANQIKSASGRRAVTTSVSPEANERTRAGLLQFYQQAIKFASPFS